MPQRTRDDTKEVLTEVFRLPKLPDKEHPPSMPEKPESNFYSRDCRGEVHYLVNCRVDKHFRDLFLWLRAVFGLLLWGCRYTDPLPCTVQQLLGGVFRKV